MAIRNYTNVAPPIGLAPPGVESNVPVLTVSSTTGYPEPPFLLAIERGTAKEELCLCTSKTTTTFTVTRGYDGTDRYQHDPGALVEHTVAAIDFREPNLHVNGVNNDHRFPGEMTVAGRPTLPPGWLWCNGGWASKDTYADLWDAIQDTWLQGAAARPDEFRLPDMRQHFAMGAGDSDDVGGGGAALGTRGGNKDATLVSHSHTTGINANATGNSGSHGHNWDTVNQTSWVGHSHSVSGGGDHWHYSSKPDPGAEAALVIKTTAGPWNTGSHAGDGAGPDNYVTFDVGRSNKTSTVGHSHSVAGDGGHRHDIGTVGDHSHSIGTAGSSPTDTNLPPWKAVNWVIKY